jgi:hypothetical protein
MHSASAEKHQAKLLSLGAALITVMVISGSVTDPVNVPKFLTLGVVASSTLAILIFSSLKSRLRQQKLALVSASLFLVALVNAVIFSNSPLSQNIYGAYGRNNGVLTYVLLIFLFLTALTFRSINSFEMVLKALLVSGVVNLIYCFWVIVFGDFVGWSNPYGNILGTFGNPNFVGSFLGMFFAAYLAFILGNSTNRLYRYSAVLVIPLCGFEIYESNAIQGRVVAALGVGIIVFYFIRSKFGNLVLMSYSVIAVTVGILALLGTLQIGPLASYLYKTSVSLRGQYWLAGWNTGQAHPLNGVGMDAFGDWYRRTRDAHALDLPGVNTVVNAAHNVPLDMFAFGGWPLFLTYLAIMGLAFASIVRVTMSKRNYDPIFVGLTVAWFGYQLQSIISINQIGLAIWGWILSGCLIAYTCIGAGNLVDNGDAKTPIGNRALRNNNPQQVHLPLVATIAGIVGFLIALPPFSADVKWRSAQVTQSASPIELSLDPSYMNPPNSMKYLTTIQIFEQNRLFDLAHKYAQEAVKWNPEAFELWKVLYLIQASTPEEKQLALENMKRLDPLNPDVTAR